MRTRLTQKETIFYQLYKNKKIDKEEYIPLWKMIGEFFCEEVGLWGFVSYEVSARLSEMYNGNYNLLERKMLKGKTGATYYGYRISTTAKIDNIGDTNLRKFYFRIRS